MSKYYVFIKDDIAVQAVKSGDVPTSEIFEVEEITRAEFLTLPLPCKRVNSVWVKVDEMPEIEYPESEPVEPITPEPTLEEKYQELKEQLATTQDAVDFILMNM